MPPPALLVLPGCAIQAISPPCLGMPLLLTEPSEQQQSPKPRTCQHMGSVLWSFTLVVDLGTR